MDTGISIPILPARDLAETRAFYERLGFHAAGWWPNEFGGYAILRRGDLSMHFCLYEEISPEQNYGQCYWRVQDVCVRCTCQSVCAITTCRRAMRTS